jgi:hypothetical protein
MPGSKAKQAIKKAKNGNKKKEEPKQKKKHHSKAKPAVKHNGGGGGGGKTTKVRLSQKPNTHPCGMTNCGTTPKVVIASFSHVHLDTVCSCRFLHRIVIVYKSRMNIMNMDVPYYLNFSTMNQKRNPKVPMIN